MNRHSLSMPRATGHGQLAVGSGETQRQRGLIDALFAAGAESDPLSMLHSAIDRSLAMTGIGLWQCCLATERLRWSQGVWDLFAMERGEEPARGLTIAHYLPETQQWIGQAFAQADADKNDGVSKTELTGFLAPSAS